MEWSDLVKSLAENTDHIKTLLLVLVPILSSLGSWALAHKRLKAEAEEREAIRRASEQGRIDAQRAALHAELIEQSEAFTQRFKTIIDAAETRNSDLRDEVVSLKREVSYLRRALNHQRVICGTCPRLKLLLNGIDIDDGTFLDSEPPAGE